MSRCPFVNEEALFLLYFSNSLLSLLNQPDKEGLSDTHAFHQDLFLDLGIDFSYLCGASIEAPSSPKPYHHGRTDTNRTSFRSQSPKYRAI